jgi:hypothetical protein
MKLRDGFKWTRKKYAALSVLRTSVNISGIQGSMQPQRGIRWSQWRVGSLYIGRMCYVTL